VKRKVTTWDGNGVILSAKENDRTQPILLHLREQAHAPWGWFGVGGQQSTKVCSLMKDYVNQKDVLLEEAGIEGALKLPVKRELRYFLKCHRGMFQGAKGEDHGEGLGKTDAVCL